MRLAIPDHVRGLLQCARGCRLRLLSVGFARDRSTRRILEGATPRRPTAIARRLCTFVACMRSNGPRETPTIDRSARAMLGKRRDSTSARRHGSGTSQALPPRCMTVAR